MGKRDDTFIKYEQDLEIPIHEIKGYTTKNVTWTVIYQKILQGLRHILIDFRYQLNYVNRLSSLI